MAEASAEGGTAQRVLDHALGVAKESVKAVAREAIHSTGSFLNSASAQLLQCLPGGSSTLVAGRHLGWDSARPSFLAPQLPAWMHESATSLNAFLLEAAELMDEADEDGLSTAPSVSDADADEDGERSVASSETTGGGSARSGTDTEEEPQEAGEDEAEESGLSPARSTFTPSDSDGGRGRFSSVPSPLWAGPSPGNPARQHAGGVGGRPSGVSRLRGPRRVDSGLHPPWRPLRWLLVLFLWPFILCWRLLRRSRIPSVTKPASHSLRSQQQQQQQQQQRRQHRPQQQQAWDSSTREGAAMGPREGSRGRSAVPRRGGNERGPGQRSRVRGLAGPTGSGSLSKSSGSSSSLSLTRHFLGSDLGRTITGAMDYFHVTQHLNDFQRRGILEELQVLLELFIDGCFEALNRLLVFVLAPWRILRPPSPGLSSAASPGAGLGSSTPLLSRLWGRSKGGASGPRASTALGAGSPTPAMGAPTGSAGLIDARTCEDIVKQAGYPFERLSVTTEDGYIITLERIPRRESRKALYLQHGVFDSSLGWVSNGVVGSQAFAAYDQGYDVYLGNMRGYAAGGHVDPSIGFKRYWAFSVNELGMCDVKAMVHAIHSTKTRELRQLQEAAQVAAAAAGVEHGVAGVEQQQQLTPRLAQCPPRGSAGSGDEWSGVRGQGPVPSQPGGAEEARGSAGSGDEWSGGRVQGQQEGVGEGPSFEIQAVAHSLGGAALMVYIVSQCIRQQPHHLSHAILLSPAGFHEKTPWLFDALAFLLPFMDLFIPTWLPGFFIPTRGLRLLFNKIAQDFQNLPALGALMQVVFSNMLVGGDPSDWVGALRVPHYTMYDMPGVAYRVMKHLAQMKKSRRFRLYDYGSAAGNLAAYGSPSPPDIGAQYGRIDIPVDVVSGRQDRLIPPQMVRKHYEALKAGGCEATLQQFEYSHLDFTLAHKQELLSYVMARLRRHSRFHRGLSHSKSCPRLPLAGRRRSRGARKRHAQEEGAQAPPAAPEAPARGAEAPRMPQRPLPSAPGEQPAGEEGQQWAEGGEPGGQVAFPRQGPPLGRGSRAGVASGGGAWVEAFSATGGSHVREHSCGAGKTTGAVLGAVSEDYRTYSADAGPSCSAAAGAAGEDAKSGEREQGWSQGPPSAGHSGHITQEDCSTAAGRARGSGQAGNSRSRDPGQRLRRGDGKGNK